MRAETVGRVRDACAVMILKMGHTEAATKLYWTPGPLLVKVGRRLPVRKVDARQVAGDRLLGDLSKHQPSESVKKLLGEGSK